MLLTLLHCLMTCNKAFCMPLNHISSAAGVGYTDDAMAKGGMVRDLPRRLLQGPGDEDRASLLEAVNQIPEVSLFSKYLSQVCVLVFFCSNCA